MILLVLTLASPGLAQGRLISIEEHGSRDKRINLVFLAEGYTSGELAKFATDVQNAVNYLFSREPWLQYRSYCNIYRIEIASNESGTDNGASGGLRDTYFNSGFTTPSVSQLLTLDATGQNRAYQLLNQFVPEFDVPLVLVNDPKYGGSGGALAAASVNASGIMIVEHELGHSFAGLTDEYDVLYASYTPTEHPNATQATGRALIRWNAWIETSTPVPTPESLTYDAQVGLFEGANYRTSGWYRPHNNSLMRSLGRPVGQVNREQFVLNYYSRVSPVDDFTPAQTNQSVSTLTNLTFAVTVKQPSLSLALTTTWEVDGVLRSGVTGDSFLIPSTALGNGRHTVKATVRDPTAFVRNDPLQLLVESVSWTLDLSNQAAVAPSISLQPASPTVVVGTNVTLSVTATGTAPLSYQWRSNGVNVAGATNATLVFNNVQTNAAAIYTVFITNSAGSVTSVNAVLTVNAPPSINTQPVSLTVLTGTNVAFTVVATGTVPLSYWWRFNGVNISGATAASYTLTNVQASQAGSYSVVVTNAAGSSTSSVVALTVLLAPAITTHPANLLLLRTNPASILPAGFTVVATGTAPLRYQWRFNGASLLGATNPAFSLANVTRADNGLYSVLVSNTVGTTTSSNALLRVRVPQRLALPERLPDGRLRLVFLDDFGGMPGPNDLAFVEVQFVTNLLATNLVWARLTNTMTATNGMLLVEEPLGLSGPRRFYRVIER